MSNRYAESRSLFCETRLVPLLSYRDALFSEPRRILIAGTSGAGKTTFARVIEDVAHIQHVEIDALFHGPNWMPRDSFVADVRQFAVRDEWVTEWQYGQVRPFLAERADLVVWLDLPRRVVMRQVIRRTLRRRFQRQVLWNGNVEPPLWTIFIDREHIVRWAWSSHRKTAARVENLLTQRPDLPVIRLRSHREADIWLRSALTRTNA